MYEETVGDYTETLLGWMFLRATGANYTERRLSRRSMYSLLTDHRMYRNRQDAER